MFIHLHKRRPETLLLINSIERFRIVHTLLFERRTMNNSCNTPINGFIITIFCVQYSRFNLKAIERINVDRNHLKLKEPFGVSSFLFFVQTRMLFCLFFDWSWIHSRFERLSRSFCYCYTSPMHTLSHSQYPYLCYTLFFLFEHPDCTSYFHSFRSVSIYKMLLLFSLLSFSRIYSIFFLCFFVTFRIYRSPVIENCTKHQKY